MHPEFEAVIGDTIALRDELCPSARVSVLSNATQLHREGVRRALRSVDNNILKLDSAFDATARLINNPQSPVYSVRRVVDQMKGFDGHLTVQTMFLRGGVRRAAGRQHHRRGGRGMARLIGEIRPRQVMVYSATATPDAGRSKGAARGVAGHRHPRQRRSALFRSINRTAP